MPTTLGKRWWPSRTAQAFGDFSCVIVLLGTDLQHVRNSYSELVKVYGQADASLIRETLNGWSAFRSILSGDTKFNHSYSYLLNTDYANLAFIWNGYTGLTRSTSTSRTSTSACTKPTINGCFISTGMWAAPSAF